MRDWVAWHTAYDDPDSGLSARLAEVQSQLSLAIERAPAGPIRLVSLCAGQGRDVLGVLPRHARRNDVRAVLVEADPDNASLARCRAAELGLPQVDVRQADAGRPAAFGDALPADVLLLCGIFGNISDADVKRTVEAVPALCSAGATVLWTRHRRPPDLTPHVRAWFADNGFDEISFHKLGRDAMTTVGVNRLRRDPPPGPPADPLFTFRTDG